MNVPFNEDGSVRITTLQEIKTIIKDFMPGTESVKQTMSTEIESGGKTYKITTPVEGANNRDLLMEGFAVVKNRLEVLEKVEEGQLSPVNVDGQMWVDSLINRCMGGTRDGLKVKWEIKEGTYKFDPFTGKLTCLK
jgi:hypothetical protein